MLVTGPSVWNAQPEDVNVVSDYRRMEWSSARVSDSTERLQVMFTRSKQKKLRQAANLLSAQDNSASYPHLDGNDHSAAR